MPGCQPCLGTPCSVPAPPSPFSWLGQGLHLCQGAASISSRRPNLLRAPLLGCNGDFSPSFRFAPGGTRAVERYCTGVASGSSPLQAGTSRASPTMAVVWAAQIKLLVFFFFCFFTLTVIWSQTPLLGGCWCCLCWRWVMQRGHLEAGIREGAKGTPYSVGEQDTGSLVKA